MSLADIKPGECAVVTNMKSEAQMRRRLQDLGLISGTKIVCIGKSPLGDPAAYLIRRAVIALRKKDADQIEITEVNQWRRS